MQFSIARSFYASAYRAMRLGKPSENQNRYRRASQWVSLKNSIIAQYGMFGQCAVRSFEESDKKPHRWMMRHNNRLWWAAARKREMKAYGTSGL